MLPQLGKDIYLTAWNDGITGWNSAALGKAASQPTLQYRRGKGDLAWLLLAIKRWRKLNFTKHKWFFFTQRDCAVWAQSMESQEGKFNSKRQEMGESSECLTNRMLELVFLLQNCRRCNKTVYSSLKGGIWMKSLQNEIIIIFSEHRSRLFPLLLRKWCQRPLGTFITHLASSLTLSYCCSSCCFDSRFHLNPAFSGHHP